MPDTTPKTTIGIGVAAKASHITNDAARIYESLWKSEKIKGVVIAAKNCVPDGGTRNATIITVEWSLPGRIVVK